MDELIKTLVAHGESITAIIAGLSLTIALVTFSMFLRPKLKQVEDVTRLKTRLETWKIPENIEAIQKLKIAVALLQQSEEQRNARLQEALVTQKDLVSALDDKIKKQIQSGDRATMRELMELRVNALETSATLARLQGTDKEAEAHEKLSRAKKALDDFREDET